MKSNIAKSLLALAVLALAASATAQVSHHRGADGALYITDPNPGVKPPVAHVDAFSSPHAVCGQAGTATVGLNVRVDRCRVWVFGPSKVQQQTADAAGNRVFN